MVQGRHRKPEEFLFHVYSVTQQVVLDRSDATTGFDFFLGKIVDHRRWLREVTTHLKVFDYSVLEILFPQLEQEEKRTTTKTT